MSKAQGAKRPTEAEMQEVGSYEFAERFLGIKRRTLYSMVHFGQIPHVRISRRMVLFRRADLEKWMAERAVPARSSK